MLYLDIHRSGRSSPLNPTIRQFCLHVYHNEDCDIHAGVLSARQVNVYVLPLIGFYKDAEIRGPSTLWHFWILSLQFDNT
jgi:hypothetical protein